MFHLENNNPPSTSEIWWSINQLIITIVISWFVSNLFAFGVCLLTMFEFNLQTMNTFLSNPFVYPQYKMALWQFQGIFGILTFWAAPMFYRKYIDNPKTIVPLHQVASIDIPPLLWVLTPFIVIGFMPIDSWIIDWNQSISLPESFKGIETWAKDSEMRMETLTKYLTSFQNFSEFLAAILVMAVIHAVGEELLFRGILQNKLQLLTKNYHIAIWITAFIFSTIHFQFYGFVPRLLLGALFGYLYVWSGNLAIPILAHFVNNGFTLVLIYVGIDTDTKVPIEFASISLVLVISFVYIFKKFASNYPKI